MTDTSIAPTGTAVNGVATTTGTYNPSTDFKNAPTGSMEASLYQNSQTASGNTTSSSSSPLLVTSGSSRATYANNVNTMNTATSNIAPSNTYSYTDKNGMTKTVNAADPNTAMKLASNIDPHSGVQLLDNNATKNADGTTTVTPNSGGTTTKTDTTSSADGTGGTTYNPDGSSTTSNSDGSTTIKNADGTSITAHMDAGTLQQYNSSIQSLNQGVTDAKSTLDQAKATLANDPAANAAIDAIKAKYDKQIQLMQAKNALLAGSYAVSGARSGMSQYASDMQTNFLSEEQDKASQRVTDLITQETQMILKAQQAFKTGDIKALDEATKAYDTANKAKIDAINKLLTESDKVVKEQQAQVKIDAATAKQKLTDDIRLSTSLSANMADSIKKSGVTDPALIDEYIKSMAESSGISNVDILRSAVTKATQAQDKLSLSEKNTQSIINKRNSTPVKKATGGTKKYANFTNKPSTAAITKVNSYIQSIGGNQAAIDAANNDETRFYKVLNAIPKTPKATDVIPQ